MFTHHPPASPAAAGPASPIIPSSAPSPTSPTSLSSRLRTLSVLRSYTHRVTTSTPSTSNDTASPSSPAAAAPPHSPSRHIWPHSPITRSASYSHTASPNPAPGARESTSDESIARSTTRERHSGTAGGSGGGSTGGSGSSARHHGPVTTPASTSSPHPASPSVPSSSPPSDDHHLQVTGPQPASQPSPTSSPDPGTPAIPRTTAPERPISTALNPAMTIVNGHGHSRSEPTPAPTASAMATHTHPPSATLPSIRFTTYVDPRSARPSLAFAATSRILPTGTEVIRVGRYSERDGHGAAANAGSDKVPNASPVGFKSKVVSRRHCEFWFDNGKWYIKDVKSSSGTFLNHIRLSPPGTESKPYPINDGDMVQLGIDFKGGEEMIFRCVKMRLELNRGWVSKPTNFNLASHKRLRSLVASNSGSNSQDCSICLNSIAPCQSLFVAPCSHTWHFKCIRSLLNTPQYPYFSCPNCRASADLEAEVDDPDEDWEKLDSDEHEAEAEAEAEHEHELAEPEGKGKLPAVAPSLQPVSPELHVDDPDSELLAAVLEASSPNRTPDDSAHASSHLLLDDDGHDSPARSAGGSPQPGIETPPDTNSGWARSAPVPIHPNGASAARGGKRTPSPSNNPPLHGAEGPITPRNNAGPWVFDGSAGRRLLMGGAGPGLGSEFNDISIDRAIDDDER